MLDFLNGKKTYVTGLVSIAVGMLAYFVPEIQRALEIGEPVLLITTGFGMIFLRKGISG